MLTGAIGYASTCSVLFGHESGKSRVPMGDLRLVTVLSIPQGCVDFSRMSVWRLTVKSGEIRKNGVLAKNLPSTLDKMEAEFFDRR